MRKPEANAITLPGGHIYVFQGLIDEARSPDELPVSSPMKFGHAAHRDGMRTVIGTAGHSLLLGMLLGDFVGGGAVMLAARNILQTSYSREVEEAAADRYGVTLMTKVGGDPRALGTILTRIAGTTHPGPKMLARSSRHPQPRSRNRSDGGIRTRKTRNAAARPRRMGRAQDASARVSENRQ